MPDDTDATSIEVNQDDAPYLFICFSINNISTTTLPTLSLHDALPIFHLRMMPNSKYDFLFLFQMNQLVRLAQLVLECIYRSEEHTSELQSRLHFVCRLLLEVKN